MQIFLDANHLQDVRKGHELGLLSGIVMSASWIITDVRERADIIREIGALSGLPVCTQTSALDSEGIVQESMALYKANERVIVKVPVTLEGLKAARELVRRQVQTNVSLVFSAAQALLSASVRPTYLSVYVGEMNDAGHHGNALLKKVTDSLTRSGANSMVMASDLRSPSDVVEAVQAGADAVVVSLAVLEQMVRHPLTDLGIERFLTEWASRAESRPEG